MAVGKHRQVIEGEPLPPLKGREVAFVAHYLADTTLNQSRAYLAAFPGFKGDASYAAREACKMMKRPVVAAHVKLAMDARAVRTEVSIDRVLTELAKIAFLDFRQFFDSEGGMIALHKLPANVAAALAGCDIATVQKGEGAVEYIAKIKPADKLRALELVGKHLGMFKESVEHTGPNGAPIAVTSIPLPSDPIEAAKAYARMIQGK